ncbi:MAG: helix-turn-helix domain-containing protein [Bifidobacterium sp.]|jgi:excisionase family DNA binding protein|nr:helix-turn-helix domain-containing protein [Bifidobacterium sp.]
MASAVALTTPVSAKTAEDAALTVAEIARSFSVSVATINRRIAAGELPAVMYRGRKFVLRSDAESAFAPQPVPVKGAADHPPIDEARLARLRSLLGGR